MFQMPLPARRAAAFVFRGLRSANDDAGWSSPVARQAHNLKVAGSNPAPATKLSPADQALSLDCRAFSFCSNRSRPLPSIAKSFQRLAVPPADLSPLLQLFLGL